MAKLKKQSTPEKAMDELTELSQELGLYDVEGNPLIKDTPTTSQEATESILENKEDESNTVVTPEAQNVSDSVLEPLNGTGELDALLDKVTDENKHEELIPTVNDKLILKDGQGKPIPTKLVVIQSMNYTDLVSQVLQAAYLGAELDKSYRIVTTVPYRIRLLLPTDNHSKWLSKEDVMVYDENVSYNKVLVRGFDLYSFWRNIIKIGKNGAIIVPRTVAQKTSGYMVNCYTRAPMVDTPEHRVGREKVIYTKTELEGFNLASLLAAGSWYGLNSNSKLKLIRGILQAQGN